MAIPETIKKLANDIRTKIYGREVREALAQGIEEAGNIADQANQTSNDAVEQVRNIQAQVDQLVVEGDSSVEAAQARVDAEGNVFTTLKERLDTKETQFENEIGILNNLQTTDKNNLVSAVNEVKQKFDTSDNLIYLRRTVTKLKLKQDIKIAIMGDSLAEPAGTGTKWTDLLFNDNYASQGYNLKQKYGVNFTTTNYAIGGHTSHLLAAQIAIERENPFKKGLYIAQEISGEVKTLPPFFKNNYDLVIISVGANGGTEWQAYAENVIRILIASGIDVIALTANPRSDNANFGNGIESFFMTMQNAYGIEVANTNKYFKDEMTKTGNPASFYLADVIHSNQEGHKLYAKAIYDVLWKNYSSHVPKNVYIPTSRVFATSNNNLTAKMPFTFEFQRPVTMSAGCQLVATYNDVRNPAYGRYNDLSDKAVRVPAGEYVEFSNDYGFGFDILYHATSTTGKIQAKIQGGTANIGSEISVGGISYNRVQLVEGVSTGIYSGHKGVNRSVRLVCTEGEVTIVGVVWLCHIPKYFRNNEYGFPAISKNGTFTVTKYHNSYCLVSNNDGDSIEFYANGDIIDLIFLSNKAGGKIDIYVNDELSTTIDTFYNNDYEQFVYVARIDTNYIGKKKLKLNLTVSTLVRYHLLIGKTDLSYTV